MGVPSILFGDSVPGIGDLQDDSYSLPGSEDAQISDVLGKVEQVISAATSNNINIAGEHWDTSQISERNTQYTYHEVLEDEDGKEFKFKSDVGSDAIGRDMIDSGILKFKATEEIINSGDDKYISFLSDCLGALTSGSSLGSVYTYNVQERDVDIQLPLIYPRADADTRWELVMDAPNLDAAIVQPEDPSPKTKSYMIGSIGRGAIGLVIHLLAANILCTCSTAVIAALTFLNANFFGTIAAHRIVNDMKTVDFDGNVWGEWLMLNRRTQILEWAINTIKRQTMSNIDPYILKNIESPEGAQNYTELKIFSETINAIKGALCNAQFNISTRMTAANVTKYSAGGTSIMLDSKSYRLTQSGTVAVRNSSKSVVPAEGHFRMARMLRRRISVKDGEIATADVSGEWNDGGDGGGGGGGGGGGQVDVGGGDPGDDETGKNMINASIRTNHWDSATKFSSCCPTSVITKSKSVTFYYEEGVTGAIREGIALLQTPGVLTGSVKVQGSGMGEMTWSWLE